jgi:hypothetical protein
MLSFHILLAFPSGVFPSRFLIEILHAFVISPYECCMYIIRSWWVHALQIQVSVMPLAWVALPTDIFSFEGFSNVQWQWLYSKMWKQASFVLVTVCMTAGTKIFIFLHLVSLLLRGNLLNTDWNRWRSQQKGELLQDQKVYRFSCLLVELSVDWNVVLPPMSLSDWSPNFSSHDRKEVLRSAVKCMKVDLNVCWFFSCLHISTVWLQINLFLLQEQERVFTLYRQQ